MFGFSIPHIRRGKTVRSRGEFRADSKLDLCCAFLIVSVLVLILAGVPYIIYGREQDHYERMVSLEALEKVDFRSIEKAHGLPVHVQGAPVAAMVSDPDFGVKAAGGIALKRETEYCQWQELATTNCETCEREVRAQDGTTATETYNCNCKTTYNYIKGWHSHTIPSLLFHQPGNHHNPLRDPYPSKNSILAPEVTITTEEGSPLAVLSPQLIKRAHAPWRKLIYSPGGLPREETRPLRTGWRAWLFGSGSNEKTKAQKKGARKVHYEALTGLPRDSLPNGFTYIGNGYFYNAYEPSIAERLLKGFAQYVEGTLFDWQLGDVMAAVTGACTAGDIRIRYQVQSPNKLSVLASAGSSEIESDTIRLDNIVLQDGSVHKALVHAGSKTPSQMIRVEASESRTKAALARAFLLVWAIPITFLIGAVVGLDFGRSFSGFFLGLIAVWAATIAIFWFRTWGIAATQYPILLALAAATLTKQIAPPSHAEPGLRAAWCMLAKFVGLPPEWRVQKSYRAQYAPKPLPKAYVPSREKRIT